MKKNSSCVGITRWPSLFMLYMAIKLNINSSIDAIESKFNLNVRRTMSSASSKCSMLIFAISSFGRITL